MAFLVGLLLLIQLCVGQPRDRFKEDFPDGIGSPCLIAMHDSVTKDDAVKLLEILKSDNAKEECNINEIIPDGSGQTLIMNAVLHGKSIEVVSALLDNGADVTIGERQGYTPIHGAGFQGRAQLAKLLVEHPNSEMNVMDIHPGDNFTPFHRACWGTEQRHSETAEMLIKLGADPDLYMCRKRRGRDGNPEDDCQHLFEVTQNPETKRIIAKYTKLDQYKSDKTEEL